MVEIRIVHLIPQTFGLVERFNGRIAELLRSTRFRSAAELSTTLGYYLELYNGHIPQRALGHLRPLQALKVWQEKEPEQFILEIYNQTGLDTTLVEMLLHRPGAINRPGSVEKGSTVCDCDPLEKAYQHSLKLAVTHFEHRDACVHLLDTPGFPDVMGQALCAMDVDSRGELIFDTERC